MRSSHEQVLWVVEFYNRQQISKFWRNCWKSSWPPANEMQGTWFKSCAGVAFPSIPECREHDSVHAMRPERKAKNHVTLTRKFLKKIWFHCPPTFLSSNPKILKAFLKPFPTKIKSTKWPAKEKKGKELELLRGEERKRKVKVKTAMSLLNSKTIWNCAFCACLNFAS